MELNFRNIFKGWNRSNIKEQDPVDSKQFEIDTDNTGAIKIDNGVFSYHTDFGITIQNQAHLVQSYRKLAQIPEVDEAIEDIVNESFSADAEENVKIDLDKVELSDSIKESIVDEFKYILGLLDFQNNGDELFRSFYIDGRSYYQKLINQNNTRKGLTGIKKLDSMYMAKIEEVEFNDDDITLKDKSNYFVYDPSVIIDDKKGFSKRLKVTKNALYLPKESVAYIWSGLTSPENGYILSWLDKAIKPANQLQMLETALVVYRSTRAVDRLIFYVDVGDLPPTKAEAHIRELMASHKSKLTYDNATGKVVNDTGFAAMNENYWMPRREGSSTTEIDTLDTSGGQQLGETGDVDYFLKKLYKALKVPLTRQDPESTMSFGRDSEITRDERKFSLFCERLRSKFNPLLLDFLRTQLLLKKIITAAEWDEIEPLIRFIYSKEQYFKELQDADILLGRIELANELEPYVGKVFSNEYVMKKVFNMTDEEIEDERKKIEEESKDPLLSDDEEEVEEE